MWVHSKCYVFGAQRFHHTAQRTQSNPCVMRIERVFAVCKLYVVVFFCVFTVLIPCAPLYIIWVHVIGSRRTEYMSAVWRVGTLSVYIARGFLYCNMLYAFFYTKQNGVTKKLAKKKSFFLEFVSHFYGLFNCSRLLLEKSELMVWSLEWAEGCESPRIGTFFFTAT